ncbi:MAG TPA: CHAT domain-containing protein [Phycisphaerales bacterium]|nr:CHAT domain-containing protein [Phycisphaerales bacterium]
MTQTSGGTQWVQLLAVSPPEEFARAILGQNAVHEFSLIADQVESVGVQDLARALDLTLRLVGAADALDLPYPKARARRARAQVLAYANQFEDALVALNQAVMCADAGSHPVEAALARMTTLHALARLGRLEEAATVGRQAHAIFADAGEALLAARADINLGVVARMRDHPAEAIEHFDRARPHVSPHAMLAAQLENNAAEALLDLNRFEPAAAAFQTALAYFRAAGASRAAAIVEGNLADYHSRRGELQAALTHFDLARAAFGSDAPGDIARLGAEQAEAMLNSGMHAEAVEHYQRAIDELEKHQLPREAARARVGLGRAFIAMGRVNEAVPYLDAAALAFRQLRNPVGEAHALAAQAEIAIHRGGGARASALLRRALPLVADRPAHKAGLQVLQADAEIQQGNFAAAASTAALALETGRNLAIPPLIVAAHKARARANLAQGNRADAIKDLREATAVLEKTRATLHSGLFRGAFLSARVSAFSELIRLLLDESASNAAEAYNFLQRSRSRSLLDLLGSAHEDRATNGGLDAADRTCAERDQLIGDLNALYSKMHGQSAMLVSDAALTEWRASVAHVEAQLRSLEVRLASNPRYADLLSRAPEAADVLEQLPPGWQLLEYFEDGPSISAFVAHQGSLCVRRGLCDAALAREAVSRLQFQVQRAIPRLAFGGLSPRLIDDGRGALADLHALLIAPLARVIANNSSAIVVPHGYLHAVPFGALLDRPVLQVPSAGILPAMRARTPRARGGPSLVVGVGDELAPQIEAEAVAVHRAVPGSTLLTGARATCAEVRRGMQGAGFVHIAGHARFNAVDPLASGIQLSDGWLTARDFQAMDLAGAAVVLSGCGTGQTDTDAANESYGLVRGVLVGGAKTAVISLWPVHDQTTTEMMALLASTLYSQEQISPAEALAKVVREFRVERHPAAWAPFICVGTP